jgi:hypothetical protein
MNPSFRGPRVLLLQPFFVVFLVFLDFSAASDVVSPFLFAGTEDDASILLRVPGCTMVAFAGNSGAGANSAIKKSRGQLLTIAGKVLLEDNGSLDRAPCGGDSLLFAPATDFTGEVELDFDIEVEKDNKKDVESSVEKRLRKGTILVSPTRDPPEAVDDEFVVTAGEWALLPVLLNDVDADIAVPVCVSSGTNDEIVVRVVMPSKKSVNSQVTVSFGNGPKQPCTVQDSGAISSDSDVDVPVCVVRAEKGKLDVSVPIDIFVSIGATSYVIGGVKAGLTVVVTHDEHKDSVSSFGVLFASESLPRCKELRIVTVSEPGNGHAMALPLPASQRAQKGTVRVGLGNVGGGVWVGGSPVSPTHGLAPGSSQTLPLVIAYHSAPGFVGDDSFSYDVGDGQPGSSQRATGTVTVHVRDAKVKVNADGGQQEDEPLSSSSKSSSSCRTWKCIVQSFDGRHNSLSQPDNGAMMTPLRRVAPSAYADKIDSPSGASRPSTRVISNALFSQPTGENVYSKEGLSELHVHFGQFLTHDIDFSTPLADFKAEGNFVIPIPADDPWFVGQTTMRFRRSGPQHGTGAGTDVPREQLNKITSFLDLNVIYGTLVGRNRGLRTLSGGKLLHMVGVQQSSNNTAAASAATVSAEKVTLTDTHCFDAAGAQHCRPVRGSVEHLALNFNHMPNLNLLGKARETLFVSGDNRVNVQPGLTAMHTLLAREHNAVADEIQASLLNAAAGVKDEKGATRTEGPSDALWRAAHPHSPSFHVPAVPAFSQPVLMELPGVSELLPAVTMYPSPPWFPQAFDGSLASLRAYDEAIFQTARAVTRAKWQAIVWYEYLPTVLGPERFAALPPFDSSRDREHVNAASTNEFATAAFRFGHSQIGSSMRRVESSSGCPAESGPISLRDAYFTAARILAEGGFDPVISGSLIGLAQEVDTRAVDEVRNLLFATHTQGFDLLAFNIQRGRDHGLPDYNSVRVAMGLPRANTFANITGGGPDCEVASTLSDLYNGNVDDIDLLVGGLAEPHVPGGSVGPLFAALIADVFVRIRDADRFWFEDTAGPQASLLSKVATLDELRSTRVADLLSRTSEALDGRFGYEVVSSASMSRDSENSEGLEGKKSKGLTSALRDSLFFARPNVLRSLDSVCGGSWAAEIEAFEEGMLFFQDEKVEI